MIRTTRIAVLAVAVLLVPSASHAWDRGDVKTFAVLPPGSSGPEGLEIDRWGNVYVSGFGFTAMGSATGEGVLTVFNERGHLIRQVSVSGSSPHLLGLGIHPRTGALLVNDFGAGQVLEVNPHTGASTVFMTLPALPHPGGSGLNDITFDRAGNVYVSDSSQGIVWKVPATGGVGSIWVDSELLRTTGVPPFGANGLRFNRHESALFIANTGNDVVLKIPVSNGQAGVPVVFANSINGPDGVIIDGRDNVWVAANQGDEIVVLDPTGKAIAKLGDFGGAIHHGEPVDILFPASIRFAGKDLLITNLALDLRIFNPDFTSVDSQWTSQVTRYTISKVRARLPSDRHDRDDD